MMDLETLKARNEEVSSGRFRRRKELTELLKNCPADERRNLLAHALFNGFKWRETPEGGEFWVDIYLRLKGVEG